MSVHCESLRRTRYVSQSGDIEQNRCNNLNLHGMYSGLCTTRLKQLAQQFPGVLILGARQVGKTTLAREAFSDFVYIDQGPGKDPLAPGVTRCGFNAAMKYA